MTDDDLHIAGRHTALDIFRFAVFFVLEYLTSGLLDVVIIEHVVFLLEVIHIIIRCCYVVICVIICRSYWYFLLYVYYLLLEVLTQTFL